MKKTEITKKFKENTNNFVSYIYTLSDQDFEKITNNKWSPGQQLKHVYLSESGNKLFNEVFSCQKKRIYKAFLNSDPKEVLYFDNVIKKIINE